MNNRVVCKLTLGLTGLADNTDVHQLMNLVISTSRIQCTQQNFIIQSIMQKIVVMFFFTILTSYTVLQIRVLDQKMLLGVNLKHSYK